MKLLLFIFPLCFSIQNAPAADYSTRDKQYKLVKALAESTHRKLVEFNYNDVWTSHPELMTLESLNTYRSENRDYTVPLSKDEYHKLFSCHHSKNCTPWFYGSASEYNNGHGGSGHFVLIHLDTHRYETIEHIVHSD